MNVFQIQNTIFYTASYLNAWVNTIQNTVTHTGI